MMKKTKDQTQEIDLNTIGKVRMKDLSTYIWSELEDILVSVPIDYKTEEHKRSRSGTLILTYGAVYIFKNHFFSELPPKYTLSLLDALKIEAYENSSLFIMAFTDQEFIIKTKYAVQIVETMAKVVAECTYGLLNILILPRFTISHERREYNENGEMEDTVKEKNKKSKEHPSKTDNLIAHNKKNSDDEDEPQEIKLADTSTKNNTSDPRKVHFDENDTENHIPLTNKPIAKMSSYFYNADINGRIDIDNENTRRIKMSELVKSRPKNALIKRCLLLAHFYDIAGSNLDDADYLKKYEQNPTNSLTIGPHFKPGAFAAAYGHALGWEANLEKITFLHFKPARFGDLLEALFINSANIKQITFVDYKYSTNPPKKIANNDDDDEGEKNKKDDDDDDPYHNKKRMMLHKSQQNIYIPDFIFSDVKKTNVTSIFFHDCDFQVISAFLTACENYSCPIEEFAITQCEMLITEIAKVLRSFFSLECFLKTRRIGFLLDKIPQFPIEQLPPFLSLASCLENLVISDLEADGSQILVAVCNSNTPLKVLKLTSLAFHTNYNMSNIALPAALMHLDFTKSSFSALAFKDTMALITSKRKSDLLANVDKGTAEFASNAQRNPVLMVKMPSIILNKDGYESFKDFNYSAMQNNICEFDWSNNRIPGPVVPFFFKFLQTQTKMRILILNNIRLDKQALFFKKLQQYVLANKLPGLDMTARLYKKFLFTFYDALKYQPFIRRLCVVGRGGGDEYAVKYTELIRTLPNLTEVSADGFLARNLEFLLNLWRAIYDSPSIKANDFPKLDLKFLRERCMVDIDDKKFRQMLGNYKQGRQRPSYIMQRADFIIKEINRKNEEIKESCPLIESDFFIASCSMPWIDSTPQAFVNEIQQQQEKGEAISILAPQYGNDADENNVSPLKVENGGSSSEKSDQKYFNPENDEYIEDKEILQEELIESDHEDDLVEDDDEDE